MRVVIRGRRWEMRGPLSFAISASIHGYILAWLAFSPLPMPAPELSVYDREIRPYEKHIVWYHLSARLPAIAPADARKDRRPPRAVLKAPEALVSGAKDDRRSRRMIFAPAPEIELPKPEPLPNVVAVTRPTRPARLFNPPAERQPERPTPVLPDAPAVERKAVAAALPVDAPVRPQPRQFQPPPEPSPRKREAALPDAPAVERKAVAAALPVDAPVRPQPRQFQSPPEPSPRKREAALPDAPEIKRNDKTPALPLTARLHAPPREFVAPADRKPAAGQQQPLPDAPAANGVVAPPRLPGAIAEPRAPLRTFTPPPEKAAASRAPTLAVAPAPDRPAAVQATLAIAGLDPARTSDFPKPPAPSPGSFSAGPEKRRDGGDSNPNAMIVVPGLLARGGPRDVPPVLVPGAPPRAGQQALVAAARKALESPMPVPPPREVSTPDPRFRGRAVYTLAIQMPNVTSYTGSWIVWFAERAAPGPGAQIQPPVPLRKVDPKYIAAAAAERVEGTVRLYAVIRKDGRVDSVELLRHLDARLDRSAQEALAKWEFTPASRNGTPIEVEAVFEIPFRLAPRPAK